MSTLALADAATLEQLWAAAEIEAPHDVLRGPEVGLVMTRGRIGGDGAAFNLGEATATRCSVRLHTPAGAPVEGHSYVLGRAPDKARIAAVCDALMQTAAAERVRGAVLDPLNSARLEAARQAAAETAPTKVEFFTLTRADPDAATGSGER